LEMTNVSVGRGTDTPFEVIGAPWLDGIALAGRLRAARLPGVGFVPVRFTPDASKHEGELCGGVCILITDRGRFQPLTTGLEIARQLRLLHADEWEVTPYDRLLVSRGTWEAVRDGLPVADIEARHARGLELFAARRAPWLLYR